VIAIPPPLRRRTREVREAEEDDRLSPLATRLATSRGRDIAEPHDPLRTVFERDRDRILHSKAFRRLKHKTQVFLNPDGDHFVTRPTPHPRGRAGRSVPGGGVGAQRAADRGHLSRPRHRSRALRSHGRGGAHPYVEGEWQHALHGVRVVEVLEPLHLTWETRDGIRGSSWRNDPPPATAEGWVCRFADRIAYLAHDVEDSVRAGVIAPGDVPVGSGTRSGRRGRRGSTR
jgi:dGTPase